MENNRTIALSTEHIKLMGRWLSPKSSFGGHIKREEKKLIESILRDYILTDNGDQARISENERELLNGIRTRYVEYMNEKKSNVILR